MNCVWCGQPQHRSACQRQVVDAFRSLLDAASGSFSFVSGSTRLTYDVRKPYNRLILAREWR